MWRLLHVVLPFLLAACTAPQDFSHLLKETASVQSSPQTLQSNIAKARAVLLSLETGERTAIDEHVSPTKYIQHNLMFPDGRNALLDALPALKSAGTRVKVLRAFADGAFVVLHSEYFLFGKNLVGFDVFRFEDGLIVEHWDALQEAQPPNPSGRTMTDGATAIDDLPRTDANKALVLGLITDGFIAGDFNKIPGYLTTPYLQHNPWIGDGLEGLKAGGATLSKYDYKRIVRVLGQGNFVLTMSDILFGGKPAASYDLFRVENGKVAEHWDALEFIPPRSEWKNANGKF